MDAISDIILTIKILRDAMKENYNFNLLVVFVAMSMCIMTERMV